MLLSQSSSLLWSTFIFILLNLSMKKSIANIKVNSPLSTSPTNALSQEKININADSYVIGVDAGTESIRVGIFTRTGHMISTSVVPWKTTFPQPGWAEQSPNEWWKAFGQACQQAVKSIDVTKIVGISIDTTACSVVILDENFKPLRPCLLWMDGRSAPQCQEILQEGKGDPALQVNCNGEGPLSAEWMIPKALWIKQNEPLLWKQARIVCEKQDYFNLMVTGKLVSSSCNVAARWHWNAEEACNSVITSGHESSLDVSFNSKRHQGRPVTLLERIGLTDLLDKWPLECIAMGDIVGTVSESAARHLGIPVGIPVTQGGPDAYVGMIGLGSVVPNELSLITGSSHLHLAVSELPATAPGVWGAYQGAPLVGLCFAEGGQCSTGSVLSWARRLLDNNYQQQLQQHTESKTSGLIDSSGTTHTTTATPIAPTPTLAYDILNAEASRIEAGSDGLLCIETFQGARTPVTDPLARGAFLGIFLFSLIITE